MTNPQTSQRQVERKPEDISWIQFEWKLGKKEFIMLGDNRSVSEDSRTFGPITFEHIIGKAIFNLTSLKFL